MSLWPDLRAAPEMTVMCKEMVIGTFLGEAAAVATAET